MNIDEIKYNLSKNKVSKYYVIIRNTKEAEECQNFLIDNGFTWNSGKIKLSVKNLKIKCYVLYGNENNLKMMYGTSYGECYLNNSILFKELKEQYQCEQFVNDLFNIDF